MDSMSISGLAVECRLCQAGELLDELVTKSVDLLAMSQALDKAYHKMGSHRQVERLDPLDHDPQQGGRVLLVAEHDE